MESLSLELLRNQLDGSEHADGVACALSGRLDKNSSTHPS